METEELQNLSKEELISKVQELQAKCTEANERASSWYKKMIAAEDKLVDLVGILKGLTKLF